MSDPKPNLVKLAKGRRLFSSFASNSQTLWMAGDYLLLQITSGYTERVRRFYYADIQSVSYARTNEGTFVTAFCAVAAALLGLLGFWSMTEFGTVGGLFVAALGLFPLAGVGFNLIAGPTCACVISTAVHSERVAALNRIPKVERVLGQIMPRIDAVQGRLTEEALAPNQPELQRIEAGGHALEGVREHAELREDRGRAHWVFFSLLAVYAFSHVFDIFFYSSAKNTLDLLMFATIIVLGFVLLIWQRGGNLPAKVKVLSPITLVLCLLEFVIVTPLGVSGAFPNGAPPESQGMQMFLLASTAAFLAPGVLGLLRMAGVRAAAPAAGKDSAARLPVRDDFR